MKSPYPPLPNTRRVQLELNDGLRLELLGHVKGGSPETGFTGTRHRHTFWEIIYIKQGRGHYQYGTRKVPVESGDLFLFEPQVFHQLKGDKAVEMAQLYVGFSIPVSSKGSWKPAATLPKISDLPSVKRMRPEVDVLYSACANADESGLNAQRGLALKVIAALVEALSPAPKKRKRSNHERLDALAENAQRFLETNLDRNVSVEELAASFYLSPHYFGNCFKSATGKSVKEFHHAARMAKAAELLREKRLNISEIAQQLGFETVHYFSRRFKEFFKVAPTQFR